MIARKIAITIPADTLRRVDRWAGQRRQSRSRFIAEQMEKRLRELEDEEVTRLYDEAYEKEAALVENRALAEELLRLSPKVKEKW